MAKLSPSVQALFDKELAIDLTEDFHNRGFSHLRVRNRQGMMVIESGPTKDAVPHARLRRETVHLWRLEMPAGKNLWQPTPYRDLVSKLVDALVNEFPWTLAEVDGKPLRTSGPRY